LSETPPWEWPRDAGDIFFKVLADRLADGADRIIAARLAGDMVVVNDALCDALVRIASHADETEELRVAAAIALGPVLEEADTFGFEDDPDDVPIEEATFHRIQDALQKIYPDESVPKLVRRRVLEASVRSPQDWHRDAIAQAYSSGDRDWMLTAVFAMRSVRGFPNQILEALRSGDSDIHFEAICAAGEGELDAAWDHVAALAQGTGTSKPLRLASIEAIGSIRPQEARGILLGLTESEDEEISEAAEEALSMLEPEDWADDEEGDEDESGDDWIH